MQPWLARFGAEVKHEKNQEEDSLKEHQSRRVTSKASTWMNIWMMIMILMLTGCQCSPRSPMKETDPDHQRLLPEVVQKEERHRTTMKIMENEEGWLKWCHVGCIFVEHRAGWFLGIEHRQKGEAADKRLRRQGKVVKFPQRMRVAQLR